jgi:NDP-sugar pyrophosphorylase family protein
MLMEKNPLKGCLNDITNYLRIFKIKDDLLIIVGDILFDFKLDFFDNCEEVKIPIKLLTTYQIKKAGWVDIDKNGYVTNCIIHPANNLLGFSELGIYYIPKHVLPYLKNCVNNYCCDSPGYFLEYLTYHKIPIKTVIVKGYWDHITTKKDLFNIRTDWGLRND